MTWGRFAAHRGARPLLPGSSLASKSAQAEELLSYMTPEGQRYEGWEQLSCPIYLKSSPPPRGRACRAATGEARAIQRGIGLMGKPAPV